MSVEDLIVYGKKYLHSSEVNILLANVLEYDTLELFNHLDEIVSESKIELYKKMIDARLTNYPIQYIIGNVNFYGYEFLVKPGVLIPRFDTEQLVYYVSNYIKDNLSDSFDLVDIGCGSGIIGITLSKIFPKANVTCIDISDDAIKLTKENAIKLNSNVIVKKGDLLNNINDKFDVIVSNPPYIAYDDNEIEDIVKNNEPHLALYADNNGLEFYDKILMQSINNIKNKFLIAFEIGYKQSDDIISLINKYYNDVNIEVLKDLSGKDRVILIYNKNF